LALEVADSRLRPVARRQLHLAREDPALVRWILVAAALGVIGILVIIPTVFVFAQALKSGPSVYVKNLLEDRDTWRSITLTLTVAPVAVAANLIFGVTAAWLIARFQFPGRTVLTTLIDLPFSVSPVVAGLMFVLIFGLQGYLDGGCGTTAFDPCSTSFLSLAGR
jgi:sulfate transport system permease protein